MRVTNRLFSFKIILFLGALQGILGALRAYNWIHFGADVFGQGLLLLPFVGALAIMRGLFVLVIAFLYMLSVVGALREKDWARSTCMTAAVLNLALVTAAVIHGGPILQAVAWSIIPVILLFYLFPPPSAAQTEARRAP
jgi:hypothetical protein